MGRPLWRIFLPLFLLAFVAQRAAVASAWFATGDAPALFAGYAFQALAGAVTALGIYLGRGWVSFTLLALGASVAATALLAVLDGVMPAALAVSRALVAAVSTGALYLVMRRELGSA